MDSDAGYLRDLALMILDKNKEQRRDCSGRKDMGYPMGYTIPTVPWHGIGMGPRGGIPSQLKDMGLCTDQVADQAYYG